MEQAVGRDIKLADLIDEKILFLRDEQNGALFSELCDKVANWSEFSSANRAADSGFLAGDVLECFIAKWSRSRIVLGNEGCKEPAGIHG